MMAYDLPEGTELVVVDPLTSLLPKIGGDLAAMSSGFTLATHGAAVLAEQAKEAGRRMGEAMQDSDFYGLMGLKPDQTYMRRVDRTPRSGGDKGKSRVASKAARKARKINRRRK